MGRKEDRAEISFPEPFVATKNCVPDLNTSSLFNLISRDFFSRLSS